MLLPNPALNREESQAIRSAGLNQDDGLSYSVRMREGRRSRARMDSVRRPMAIVIAVLANRLATSSLTRGAMAPIVQKGHLHTKRPSRK